MDLISIDRRSRDREAECLERASALARRFQDSVQDAEDYVWKPADRCVFSCQRKPAHLGFSVRVYSLLAPFCSPEPPNKVAGRVITVSREKDRPPGKLQQFAILFR